MNIGLPAFASFFADQWSKYGNWESPETSTGCGSQNENHVNFKILKEPMLVLKQTILHMKALDLSYLEPEGQGQVIIMRA